VLYRRNDGTALFSLLGYDYINLLGRYTFSLSEEIRQEAFHPLHEVEETEQESEDRT
jgi:hypothetical protein